MRRLAAALALAVAAASGPGPAGAEPVTLRADLPDRVLASLRASRRDPGTAEEPAALLARIFSALSPYHFEAGLVGVDTDPRWFQTLPPDVPGGAVLELRRWPGDTVLALYALEGESSPEAGPSIAGATLSPLAGEASQGRRFEGTLATPLGERPIAWLELPVPGAPRRLGALLIPGDAGFGTEAVPGLVQELLAVLGRIELRGDAWTAETTVPALTPLVPPELDAPPADADENQDPWQVVEGAVFTLGLPPGVRARRLDQGVAPPRPATAAAALWLRGRFVDRKGVRVVIGDGTRSGYLAFPAALDRAWIMGEVPPLGAARAKRVASEDFSLACEQTGAETARGERWSEPGFAGDWLVFRMAFKGTGIELGLPILSGRQSEALFWIPTTLRGRGETPAPPPLDPAERFGISFTQFTKLDQKRHPGSSGYLVVPGVRFEIPSGWTPVTTLRSAEGFPVQLFDAKGRAVGQLVRSAPGTERAEGWTPARKRSRSGSIYRRSDGARLHVSADGKGTLLVPAEKVASRSEWERLVESATLLKPEPRKVPPVSPEGAGADR